MTMGHYATALVPFSRLTNAPIWWLLLCAQLPDFVWFVLSVAGVEKITPPSFLDISILVLHADSLYSHGLIWILIMAVVAAAGAFVVTRRKEVALWSAGLIVFHLLCDWLSGWEHETAGAGSLKVGLDLYRSNPYLAFGIEVVFTGALVAWYLASEKRQGRALTTQKAVAVTAVFVGGATFFIATATHSMRQLLGL